MPDLSYDHGSSVPYSHFGNGYHGSGGITNNGTSQACFTYLHDTSGLSAVRVYYRLQWLPGHGSGGYSIYLNRSHDMSDQQRMTATSNVVLMEVKA